MALYETRDAVRIIALHRLFDPWEPEAKDFIDHMDDQGLLSQQYRIQSSAQVLLGSCLPLSGAHSSGAGPRTTCFGLASPAPAASGPRRMDQGLYQRHAGLGSVPADRRVRFVDHRATRATVPSTPRPTLRHQHKFAPGISEASGADRLTVATTVDMAASGPGGACSSLGAKRHAEPLGSACAVFRDC